MPGITHWQHQKWFGYFPSVVTFESILGDLYSSSVTNPGFNVSVPASWQFVMGMPSDHNNPWHQVPLCYCVDGS